MRPGSANSLRAESQKVLLPPSLLTTMAAVHTPEGNGCVSISSVLMTKSLGLSQDLSGHYLDAAPVVETPVHPCLLPSPSWHEQDSTPYPVRLGLILVNELTGVASESKHKRASLPPQQFAEFSINYDYSVNL